MSLLEVDDVVVQFGGVTAVNHASFAAEAGQVTGLIGPNGAGKTTCFNVISGLQRPTRGRSASTAERHPAAGAPPLQAGDGPHLPAAGGLRSLIVRDNVRVALDIHRGVAGAASARPRADVDALLERVGIAAYADERADSIPTGTARLLELARCLAGDPQLLLLDEPSSGLDETETDAFGELLRDLAAEGRGDPDGRARHGPGDEGLRRDPRARLRRGHRLRRPGRRSAPTRGCSRPTSATPTRTTPDRRRSRSGRTRPRPPRPDRRASPVVEGARHERPDPRGRRPARGLRPHRGAARRRPAVPKGAVMALLGPNGAGKSTLVKMICGQKKPTSGDIHLGGVNVHRTPAPRSSPGSGCARSPRAARSSPTSPSRRTSP